MQRQVHPDHQCSICLGILYHTVYLSKCRHFFCQSCIEEATESTEDKRCPLCRTIFHQSDIVEHLELQKQINNLYPHEIQEMAKSIHDRITYYLTIGNTTKFLPQPSINKYEWTLYVKPAINQPPLQHYAEKVQLFLHPTFHPSTLSFLASDRIELRRKGWGTFRIQIKITWKEQYGTFTDFFHDLSFEPVSEAVRKCKLNGTKQ